MTGQDCWGAPGNCAQYDCMPISHDASSNAPGWVHGQTGWDNIVTISYDGSYSSGLRTQGGAPYSPVCGLTHEASGRRQLSAGGYDGLGWQMPKQPEDAEAPGPR